MRTKRNFPFEHDFERPLLEKDFYILVSSCGHFGSEEPRVIIVESFGQAYLFWLRRVKFV